MQEDSKKHRVQVVTRPLMRLDDMTLEELEAGLSYMAPDPGIHREASEVCQFFGELIRRDEDGVYLFREVKR